MLGFRRNREAKHKLLAYIDCAVKAISAFEKGTAAYLEGGISALDKPHDVLKGLERECDAHRYGVEREMFEKALLPESREDILDLIEKIDLVVNQAEESLRKLLIERIILPENVRSDFSELCLCAATCAGLLLALTRDVLKSGDFDRAGDSEVNRKESQADMLEQRITRTLFASELTLAEKMHYRDAAGTVAAICDHAENAANELAIFFVKRNA